MSIEVQTTQNVTIDYEPAGLGYRMLAYSADWVIIGIWILGFVGIAYLGSSIPGMTDILYLDSFAIIFYIAVFFPVVFYDLLFETLNHGQTPGKMLFKIRVVNVDGTAPSFGGYLLRWLFRLVDIWLFYAMVAIIFIVVTKNGQRLGDLIGKTTVVDLKMKAQLKLPELDFHDDYKVTYRDVLDRLSDKDIQTVRSIIEDVKMKNGEYFIAKLAHRIKLMTGYAYEGPDTIFLRKVVSDYDYLALQQ